MKAKSINEAWQKVNEIFPTDYTENTIKTINAGYPIYDSNLGDNYGYICDFSIKELLPITYSKKDNSIRGVKTVYYTDLKIGDKIVIDNYFHTITE